MSDSITKTPPSRFVWPAAVILSALVACAAGSGSPTSFVPEGTDPSYDAATSSSQAAPPEGDAAGSATADSSYAQQPAASCGASWDAASPNGDDGDGATADDLDDADVDDAGSVAVAPSLGDLIITEIMFDPSGPVPEAQWFEIYNLTSTPELLSGLTIQDGWGDTQVISSGAPVVAPPFTYVVLVRDMATALANAIPAASIVYEYGTGLTDDQGIELAFDGTGDLSLWNGGLELVDVPYGPWGLSYEGDSIELATLQYVGADQPGNWCVAQLPWAPGSDYGTPGLASDCF
ncbi:MAG: hypothetical protein ACLP1X_31910 [Polyangiaceae bacterium]|jgi:hypothetical protein